MHVNKAIGRVIYRCALRAKTLRGRIMLRRLEKQTADARRINEQTLLNILKRNADTELGREWKLDTVRDVQSFRERIPLTEYMFYYDRIKRMLEGNETGVLTNYPITFFAVTSGTTGDSKRIPVSEMTKKRFADMAAFRLLAVMDRHYKKTTGKPFPCEKGFLTLETRKLKKWNNVGAVSTLAIKDVLCFTTVAFSSPPELMQVSEKMDTRYLKTLFALAEHDLLYIAGAYMSTYVEIMRLIRDHWEQLVEDIRTGTISRNVQVSDEMRERLEQRLHPDPARADFLKQEFEKGFDTPIIPRIWKSCSFISGIGSADFSIYVGEMRKYAGDIPFDFGIYGASEGLFAVCFEPNRDQFLLLPDSVFYEFLPVGSEDGKTCLIDELEVGREYEMIVTNDAGLYRYCIKDVVKVTEYRGKCPVVAFSYRRNQLLNAVGEKTSEAAAQAAVRAFAEETGCHVDDFCFYIDMNDGEPCYAAVIEDHHGIGGTDTSGYAEILDRHLSEQNHAYGFERKGGGLGPLRLRLTNVPINTLYHEACAEKGGPDNQLKPLHLANTESKREALETLMGRE
ncbi:MAG: GH3 auxin-responsive promoter family protein [Oscillospiraceae bacterium]|nr:GH3 auxin-responsive promoter family protein [Oscillospiraceae bacterium]